MKLLFITNVPSPYRVDFFNELGKFCDLTVCFERKTSSERDEKWRGDKAVNFKEIYANVKPVGVDRSKGKGIVEVIKMESFDKLIITGYSSPAVAKAIIYCKRKKISYCIESDGGFYKKDNFFKRWIKKYLLCSAEKHFTTCQEHSRYLQSIGIKEENIVIYPFTSLYKKDIIEKPISVEEKKILREKLGITETKVVLSVGRFVHRKGFDILLQAITLLSRDVGLYIIGGTPTEEYLKLQEEYGLTNVHFLEFKKKDELREWYLQADCFALPTRGDIWGLVINEAMACGLPVITTDKCIAGLELVKEGVNGHVVPVDNVEALADGIQQCLDNKETYSVATLERIQDYTIEKMTQVHLIKVKYNEER